jgi:hypothetical protein
MTDPHLFDAGGARHGEGVQEEALDNRAAFEWAILETNRLVLAEHRAIDFVVITGDFGLENVRLPQVGNTPAAKSCECPKRRNGKEGPTESVSLPDAAEETARHLEALLVRRVYLVPGNNDLCDENPHDLHRWAEFVLALRTALQRQEDAHKKDLQASFPNLSIGDVAVRPLELVDLTYTAERLYKQKDPHLVGWPGKTKLADEPPPPPEFAGIRLVGIDSAYFKPHDTRTIQDASLTESTKEMDFVSHRIQDLGSYLVFTHIPDVQDPFQVPATKHEEPKKSNEPSSAAGERRGGETFKKPEPDRASSWKISEEARKEWHDRILSRSDVIAVFAGHFHTSLREPFTHDFSHLRNPPDDLVAEKMWVAPPLAVKYQHTVPQGKTARGILLVTVTSDGGIRVAPEDTGEVKTTPIWYATADQKAATEGDDQLLQARAEELDGHWETAAGLYAKALASGDSRARTSASEGFWRARAVTRTWWWRWGKYFPPFRWWHIHHRATKWALIIIVLLLLSARFTGTGILGLVGRGLRFGFMPRFRGRARVISPASLTTDSPTGLLAAQIPISALDVRRRWERAGVKFLSGGTTLLSLPSAVADQISQNFPDVYNINVGKFVAFLLSLARYFTWRVESQLAYSPNPPATPGGTAGPAGRMRAFATLRWGWFVRTTFQVTPKAAGPLDCERAAYAIAARVLGAAQKKSRR